MKKIPPDPLQNFKSFIKLRLIKPSFENLHYARHCEERKRRSNLLEPPPPVIPGIASLRSQWPRIAARPLAARNDRCIGLFVGVGATPVVQFVPITPADSKAQSVSNRPEKEGKTRVPPPSTDKTTTATIRPESRSFCPLNPRISVKTRYPAAWT